MHTFRDVLSGLLPTNQQLAQLHKAKSTIICTFNTSWCCVVRTHMGVAARGGGLGDASPPPSFQNSGKDVPQKSRLLKKSECLPFFFLDFPSFQNKVTEIRGEIRIWGQVVLTHLNSSPLVRTSWRLPDVKYFHYLSWFKSYW